MNKIIERRNELIFDINHGKVKGSLNIARSTAEFLQFVISKTPWTLAREILDAVKKEEELLKDALPMQVTVINVVQQILHIIREEYRTAIAKTKPAIQTVQRFLEGSRLNVEEENYTVKIEGLQDAVIDHVAEYETELELSTYNISEQAGQHILDSDIIMTVGHSALVEAFLLHKAAEKKPQFEVIVVEGSPSNEGHTLAKNLAGKGISTTLVPDCNVFAMMSRVNKVIVGTSLVLGNGGLQAITGVHNVALAAKHHTVPVILLAPTYKFTPKHNSLMKESDITSLSVFASPQGVIDFALGDMASKVQVFNPMYDYVPPEYLTLLISNIGGYEASFMYLVLRELYGSSE